MNGNGHKPEIDYRWLDGDEACQWLNSVMQQKGWAILNPPTARALCAFKDGRVVGFIILQLFPHAEPGWVDPEFRGTGIFEALSDKMYEFLKDVRARGFMVIADNPFTRRVCESKGMKLIEHPVYVAIDEVT